MLFQLKYHESGKEKTCAPNVGQWNMINKKMVNGATVESWTCLNFSRMCLDVVYRLCDDLVRMCNGIGMVFNQRPAAEVRSATPNNIEAVLKDVHKRAPNLQLLIVIFPDVSGYYGKIKKVCETDLGIVSQCLAPGKASRANVQYLENVALKINVKVGGRNTVLERAVRGGIPFVTDVPTIIFGADVTHPAPGEDSSASIVAGKVNGGMIRELMIAFCRKTNCKPGRIIFYRDGVSDGQFNHVLLHEMDAIRSKDQFSIFFN